MNNTKKSLMTTVTTGLLGAVATILGAVASAAKTASGIAASTKTLIELGNMGYEVTHTASEPGNVYIAGVKVKAASLKFGSAAVVEFVNFQGADRAAATMFGAGPRQQPIAAPGRELPPMARRRGATGGSQ